MADLHHRVAQPFQNNYHSDTPLAAVYIKEKKHIIHGDDITAVIRAIVRAASTEVGFTNTNVSAQSLITGGAMVLLLAQVDTDTIHLVSQWKINTMICYLHMTAKSVTQGMSVHMVQHGTYALIPPAHMNLYHSAAPLRPSGHSPKGFQGAWYRISVVLAI